MNLVAKAWEVFYSDESIYNSKDYLWVDIPQDNIVGIIIWHDYHIPNVRQKTILAGTDYYFYDDENSWGTSNNYDEVKDKVFKRGIWVTDEEFEIIYRNIFEKLDF